MASTSALQLVAALLALTLCSAHSSLSKRQCNLGFAPGTTVVFVADPGTFSNTPEAAFYLLNLKDNRKIRDGSSACPSVNVGKLLRQNAAVITTGIGPSAAALCVYDVMVQCGAYVKDVIYSGTSGWSAQLGGVINNGTCDAANGNAKLARLGDVCVSPFSVNWDCRMASHLATATGTPNQCVFPEQNGGPADDALFGQCQFTKAGKSLADEVVAANSKKNNLPTRNDVIQDLEQDYWATMSNGTGINYPALPQSAPPKLWTYTECMEIDSQYFWSGAPWDMVSRAYVAEAMNKALGSKSYSQKNVIGVSAMEAIGLGMAMERYHGLSSTRRTIPYTYVRGMSDWVHTPVMYEGSGNWKQGPTIENFEQGYKYAIATASSVVLTTLQARCEKGVYAANDVSPEHYKPDVGSCTFTVTYN